MPGVFKKLNASDIKITPFEAHKQYNTVNLPSIGAITSSLAWSGNNKSEFSTGSRKYYQIDKLYYRNYITERAHRLELDDATYTTQERRLYQSASLLSLSQKTFGSEVQPNSFEISGSSGSVQFNLKDDGFGNLYDVNLGKNNFPNEDNRVFYLAPVNGFKRTNLMLDIETGNEYTHLHQNGYSNTGYDDSYFQNIVTFESCSFLTTNNPFPVTSIIHQSLPTSDFSRITIEDRPYLNFNDEDFTISFFYIPTSNTNNWQLGVTDTGIKSYILTKEGAQPSPPLGTQAGGNFSLNTSGALDIRTVPSNPAFPYRIYATVTNNTGSVHLERFDGENLATISGSFYKSSTDHNQLTHILLQKTGSTLEVYKNGVLSNSGTDTTIKSCQNKANAVIFNKITSDGSYYDGPDGWGGAFSPTQFQIWNQSMSLTQIAMISESFTGTYPVGNLFYDNGFAVITHPKYMNVFDKGTLNTLKYKNTHLITENEYQCTMNESEFEFTRNVTARKIPNSDSEDIANFATGSNFKPYITTIGLHDNNGNLLVVGKLAQPVRASSETNTTFVIRYDT